MKCKLDPTEKLVKRLEREFKKCTYIGDIQINDDEYLILMELFRWGYKRLCESKTHEIGSIGFAVALVQIGIRRYDGKFWPYVARELGIANLPGNQQAWIGKSFYNILIKYGKSHVGKADLVNNILLHCFITGYYANDLFDFLFAYYQIDLERDLRRNDKSMKTFLMQSMSKSETSVRAYKIKKHTADAVLVNERGCRIRVGRILRFMDNALFYDSYPDNSQNRIARLFCEWAQSSDKFNSEKKHTHGISRNGRKSFSTPYIHFDTAIECFRLVFPSQYIHLDDEEMQPDIVWQVVIGDFHSEVSVESEECVTGCKSVKGDVLIPSNLLFKEISIDLYKNNGTLIRHFRIKSDSVRFFDDEWDIIESAAYSKYLPIGHVFAFTELNDILVSDSGAISDCQQTLNYNLYSLNLEKGCVLRLPDGKAKSVGKPLEEGLLIQNLVEGAAATCGETILDIYSAVPAVYFKMKPSQTNGTLIVINEKKIRFDIESCVRFDSDEKTEEKGYILNLDKYITDDGIYKIIIDIPNSKKERVYSFVLQSGFSYKFDKDLYIFAENGTVSFSDNSIVYLPQSADGSKLAYCDFTIMPDCDYLPFVFSTVNGYIDFKIFIPALKWKFDDAEWCIHEPQEIWHKEFPRKIYIKYPRDDITFSMLPIMLETSSEEDDDISFSVRFTKNKENIFECDTRKMISWFGYEEPIRKLRIEFDSMVIQFAKIVTRCYLNNFSIFENIVKHELVFNFDISGFFDCFADIYYEDELLVQKEEITTGGVRLKVPFRSGEYRIDLFEKDDEDDFGVEDYSKIATRKKSFNSKYSLTGKQIIVKNIIKKCCSESIFQNEKYELKFDLIVSELVYDEYDGGVFYGKCMIAEKVYKLRVSFVDEKQTLASIDFYDEEEAGYFEFLYDKVYKTLTTEQDTAISAKQAKDRYVFLDSEEFQFDVKIK